MKWIVLARFYLDSGTEYMAAQQVTHPSYVYEGRVLDFGHVDRSIPVPAGIPQVGDAMIRMADTDRHWRDLLSHQTPRRRMMQLQWVPDGGSESAYESFGNFEIVKADFGPGDVTISLRDVTFQWLQKKIPNAINRTNFPDLAEGTDEAFLPVIFGSVISRDDNPQGVIPLPHIGTPFYAGPSSPESSGGMTVAGADRWALSATPIHQLVAVYRKKPTEGAFSLVDSSEYFVTSDEREIDGLLYTIQWLDFYDLQPDGTEIRVDAHGINYRGSFGGLPEASGEPLRNPIDALISILYAVLALETSIPAFNTDSFLELWVLFGGNADTEGSVGFTESAVDTLLDYKCDGAITEEMTAQEWLAQFLTSFEMDLFVNKDGELTVALTRDEDVNRPVLTDTDYILKNSVRQSLANPTFNRLRYKYERNYATKQWGTTEIYDNTADQDALGVIEEDIFELWWVRDALTAADVVARRAAFVALGSYRIELEAPAPEVRSMVELAKQVGITHYGGLDLGGYINREFKITGLTLDLNRFVQTIRGIVRVPQDIEVTTSAGASVEGTGTWEGEIPQHVLALGINVLADASTHDYARTRFPFDTGWHDSSVDAPTYEIEIVGKNSHATDSVDIDVICRTDGSHCGTVTISPDGGAVTRFSRGTFTPKSGSHTYYLQTQAWSGSGATIYEVRIITHPSSARYVMLEYPMGASGQDDASSIDYSIGAGDIDRIANLQSVGSYDQYAETETCAFFKYTASDWSEITSIRFWVLCRGSVGAYCVCELYDRTIGAEVSESVCQNPDGDGGPEIASATFDPSVLTDGHMYSVRFKSTVNNLNAYIYNAGLQFHLDRAIKGNIYWRVMKHNQNYGNGNGPSVSSRAKVDLAVFLSPACYFESPLKNNTATEDQQEGLGLFEHGTNDSGTSGATNVAEIHVGVTTSFQVLRTSDLVGTITSGDRFYCKGVLHGVGNLLQILCAFMVVNGSEE